MPLALYRRHRPECKGQHPHNLRTSEYDEGKKGWRRCECPIFASVTLGKHFKRGNTGQWEFEAARAVVATLERAGTWTTQTLRPPEPEEPRATRITVQDGCEAFLAKCKNRNIATNTPAKYRTFINQLNAYCQHRGCIYIDQLAVTDMDRFYASWKDGIRVLTPINGAARKKLRSSLGRYIN